MSGERTRPWATYGRRGLVVLLTAGAVQNGAAVAGGDYATARTVLAVLCGAALLVPRSPWFLAPVLTVVATGLWGWTMLPLLLVALFDLASRRRGREAVACCLVVLAANAAAPAAVSLWRPQAYGAALFLLLALVGGLWQGNRRRLVASLHTEVEHLRVERELREAAARAAERSRIAAEMHDVLAHRLSLIALHAGVLAARTGSVPEPVADRLALLRTTATEALTDLRDVLGALHDGTGDEEGGGARTPVLRDVHELVEQAREAGQPVEVSVAGDPQRAPAAHRLALYRIVQEGLTNARKHAAGAPVRLRLDYGPPATVVELVNGPGRPAPGTDLSAPASGFGLVGLGERVHALGGHLDAGPNGSGSWRLAARLPHPSYPSHPEQNGGPRP
ncbi:two-component sensor histidine kinase [Kitasatospora phosalacinea]|uniref:histidine kinase n=1 Tax=Kitasatospora phosalacinea TaxID=2065 RepID=A0A9W6QF78_9ACTN|nr:histidine kinase [Kitasatospora phosalacinea]GLW73873.1 two-component sensor histidine kinase [Kitasatospora phosalacinea]